MQIVFIAATQQAIQNESIKNTIIEAFNPITDFMAGISYPVCYVMMATGLLIMTTGGKEKGTKVMKWAGIGYLGMQFLPQFMQILSKVGDSIKVAN